jgi:hypothetical protein
MAMMRTRRRWFLLVCAAAAAGALVGGVIAAESRDAGIPEDVASSLLRDPLVQVADIPAEGGKPRRGVFLQVTSAGYTCVWEAPTATSQARRGGCSPSEDPFGGKTLTVNFTYDGGPAPASVSDARLFGLAARDVARVRVVMSDGTSRDVRLSNASGAGKGIHAFGYRVKPVDLRRSVTPIAVVALDAGGTEIDRQATGF